MNRLLLTALVALGSASTTAVAQDRSSPQSLERLVQTQMQTVPGHRPDDGKRLVMASLPGEPVRNIRQTLDSGGFEQVIALGGSSMIEVRYRRTMSDSDLPAMQKPSEAGIRAELAARFPGMTMVVVDRPRSNAYGVYGLAAGKSNTGASCLYAWQWKDTADDGDTMNSFDALSVRVSLCRQGVTLDQLATVLDRLQIGATRMTVAADVASRVAAAPVRRKPTDHAVLRKPRSAEPRPAMAMFDVRPPAMATAESRLAAVDPGLDPSLPAAAYQGPSRQSIASGVSR